MNKQQLKELFEKYQLNRVWTFLEPTLKNSIHITPKPTEDALITTGSSKFGGSPDLPENIDWFEYKQKPMSFLAQINLTETAEFDTDSKLPKKGILYFFYDAEQDAWGFDPKDKDGSKVFFYDGDTSKLERKEKPNNLDKEAYFNGCTLDFKSSISMLDYQSSLMDDFTLEDEEEGSYENLIDEIYEYEIFKLLGHSNNIQGGMELECELVTNGINCGSPEGYRSSKRKELEKNAALWHLLFQFDSSDDTGAMWGDSGRIYYWIRENDLQEKKFENSWAILQCC